MLIGRSPHVSVRLYRGCGRLSLQLQGPRARFLRPPIALLQAAASERHYSHEAVKAIQFTNQLWRALITDLSSPENQLSEQLLANLISVGIWILGETDKIRRRVSLNFQGVLDITLTVRAGLAY